MFTVRRLCDSCSESVITRGACNGEELVYCNSMRREVLIHVIECNRFRAINTEEDYHDFESNDLLAEYLLD
jgi:hypothetical protein